MTFRFRSLWRNLVHRKDVEHDLDEEVRSTFRLMVDEKTRAGIAPQEAHRLTMVELGGIEPVKQQVRDGRAGALVEAFALDVKYAARLLRRNPLFTLTAALSLAIGIGANTTIFTIANALLLSPPTGVVEPSRVVDIGRTQTGVRGGAFGQSSYPNYVDVRERVSTLEDVYSYLLVPDTMNLAGPVGVEPVLGNIVSLNYFTVLGVRPAVGRLFSPSDGEQPGASSIAVLSHRFWSRRYNADPGIVGRALQLNGRTLTVVGVAPEGFRGTSVVVTDVWVPTTMASMLMPNGPSIETSRDSTWLMMGGRLKSGVSLPQARAELDTIGKSLEREHPENRGSGLGLVPALLIPGNLLPIGGFLGILMAIVSLVLVIACANVAGVLLARATSRRREIAVRMAIGAGRGRIVRQLLTETAMLFCVGGAAGLILARTMTSALLLVLPVLPVPVDLSLALDGRVVAFTIGLSLMAALLSGLVPALQTSKTDVVSALKDATQARASRFVVRDAFIVLQVAFSITLVVGAGLFVRALQRGSTVDLGFEPQRVELVSVDFSAGGYTEATGPQFATELVNRVRALPGVQDATLAAAIPMGKFVRLAGRSGGLTVPGATPPDGERFFDADWNVVEPGYFSTMRIPIVAGRDFNATDRASGQAAAIVSEAAARQFWPQQRAIGQYVQLERVDLPGTPDVVRPLVVIGVARDTKFRSLAEEAPGPLIYVPLQQHYVAGSLTLITRSIEGQRAAGSVRSLVASMNRSLTVESAQTLDDVVAVALVPQRVAAAVSASLGIVGVLLAAIGIYGVTAFAVTRRTREIGIRIALGAQRAAIVGMVLRQGMRLVAIGSVIGLTLAAAAGRLLRALLFGIPPIDPVTFAGAAALFSLVGLAACWVPARRATRIDAMAALRTE